MCIFLFVNWYSRRSDGYRWGIFDLFCSLSQCGTLLCRHIVYENTSINAISELVRKSNYLYNRPHWNIQRYNINNKMKQYYDNLIRVWNCHFKNRNFLKIGNLKLIRNYDFIFQTQYIYCYNNINYDTSIDTQ